MMGPTAYGHQAVWRCTVVQDPQDAEDPGMPAAALNRVVPDHAVRLVEMPPLLTALARQPAGESAPVLESIKLRVEIARGGHRGQLTGQTPEAKAEVGGWLLDRYPKCREREQLIFRLQNPVIVEDPLK